MMAKNTLIFNDTVIHQKISKSHSPNEIKALGRKVRNFDENIWYNQSFDIVITANMLKFGQNTVLFNFLLSTGNKILVDASPIDFIWGIDMAEDDP